MSKQTLQELKSQDHELLQLYDTALTTLRRGHFVIQQGIYKTFIPLVSIRSAEISTDYIKLVCDNEEHYINLDSAPITYEFIKDYYNYSI